MRPACVLLFAVATSLYGADAIRWGAPHNNLQLGIGATATALHFFLKNASTETMDLPIGSVESRGHAYNVQITAHSPEGNDLPVFDTNGMGIAGSFGPSFINATIPSGHVWEIIIPFSQLICVIAHKDVQLPTLLKQGYPLRASFAVNETKISAPEFVFEATLTPTESARESREDDFPLPGNPPAKVSP
jgi:hypothetical protein